MFPQSLEVAEKAPSDRYAATDSDTGYHGNAANAVRAGDFTAGDSLYARLQRAAGKLGVEQRGIERVPDDERTDTSMSNVGTLWLSANMVVSSFAIGVLALPVFQLGFVDTALTIVFFNLLGALPVCFFATFGPRFGLRQIVMSRFWFGFYGTKLIACFNILACIGWSSINVMVGSQLIHAVNPAVPGWAGILIIALVTLVICTFGYKLVHRYERYSWMPCFVIFLIVMGTFAHGGAFQSLLPLATGPTEAGSVLSFGASVFGFATGWTAYAADYTVYQPADRRRNAVFLWTLGGLLGPLCFTQLLGAAVMTAPASRPAYADGGVGGVLAAVLGPPLGRFGDVCLVGLALSIVANNCPNIYSVSLSLQVLSRRTQRVPRFLWTAVGTAVYVALAVAGYSHFEAWLENFMLVIGYWLAIYEAVALAEHALFRRGFAGYHPDDYTEPRRLPPGVAALGAFACGVVGAVLGMAQVFFTGPIGRLCGGEFGGDVGFELAFVFAALSYCVLRTWEKSYFRR